ncbi:putative lyase [Halomonas elongata]|uniref:Putative lyase n=1 Tax=Halomonas elongata TaxID=2746 RepID=A0A1B8NYF4_HALEL|nr:putative lyase [Halomonas elongata]
MDASTTRLPLAGVHHVALITADYPRARRFYLEVLDAEILNETYREERDSHKLDLLLPGGIQLELFSFPSPPHVRAIPKPAGCATWRSPQRISAPAWHSSKRVAPPPNRSASTSTPVLVSPFSPTRTALPSSATRSVAEPPRSPFFFRYFFQT